jgi:hypothetical protein
MVLERLLLRTSASRRSQKFGYENPLGDVCFWARIDTLLLGRVVEPLTEAERRLIGSQGYGGDSCGPTERRE